MIVLNFSHPLTPDHLAQIEALTGQAVERVMDALAQFDHAQSFPDQVTTLLDSLGLSSTEWQTLPQLPGCASTIGMRTGPPMRR